jgi:hypothetical protein
MQTSQHLTHAQVVAAIKQAIEADIVAKNVPTDVPTFDDLHLYVDANTYTDAVVAYTGDVDDWYSRITAVTREVDEWLQSGRQPA